MLEEYSATPFLWGNHVIETMRPLDEESSAFIGGASLRIRCVSAVHTCVSNVTSLGSSVARAITDVTWVKDCRFFTWIFDTLRTMESLIWNTDRTFSLTLNNTFTKDHLTPFPPPPCHLSTSEREKLVTKYGAVRQTKSIHFSNQQSFSFFGKKKRKKRKRREMYFNPQL